MCGIFGSLIANRDTAKYNLEKILESMRHRGPDQNGTWSNDRKSILLAHTRLSILDLSPKGCQPMHSSSGRFIIVYNGEIYNHKILRNEIFQLNREIVWKSQSDTETLLELFEVYGVEKSLTKIDGMFAFGVWDCKNKELILARDKIGQKPLYYGWTDNDFIFASELKSIKMHPKFSKEISAKALNYYFAFSYIKAPYSIYKNFYKLLPGAFLKIKENQIYDSYNPDLKHLENSNFYIKKWWSVSESYKIEQNKLPFFDLDTNANSLEKLLLRSIDSQMISDVPLGSFLSGGIDSSLITTLMQKISLSKVKTFTIGFEDPQFDESISARNISKYIGTEHTELILKPNQTLSLVTKIHEIYDEPFSDSSQIPTYFLSKLAAKDVKVALSGDGGDELFGGYNRYLWVNIIWKKMSIFPFFVRKIVGTILLNSPEFFWNFIEKQFKNSFNRFDLEFIDRKIKKLAIRLMQVQSLEDFYYSLTVEPEPEDNLVIEKTNLHLKFDEELNLNDTEKMMAEDKKYYLPDDIMCKVDRASMSNSLETRAPFLSSEILNFSAQLPLSQKISNRKGKIILKHILKKHMPNHLFERPKKGFGIPIDHWLKYELKELVFSVLDEKKIKNQGLLNYQVLKKILDEHYTNKRNWGSKIWSILMFQNWLDNQ